MPTVSFKKATHSTSIKHNNREFNREDKLSPFHKHIDFDKTNENVIFEKTNIRDKYQEIFGDSVQEYNAKQKRKDRKIENYYDKVCKDGNLEPQREFIIEFGNYDDIKKSNDFVENLKNIKKKNEFQAKANEMLKEYYRGFVKRNPNLVVYNAVIHNDEAVPHLHLNVIPVASGYKRGMQLQPSFNKALEQQGYKKDPHDSRKLWRDFREAEVKAMSDILQEHGLEREVGKTNHIKTIQDYKAIKQAEHSQLTQEVEQLKAQLKHFDEQEVGSDVPTLQRLAKTGKTVQQDYELMKSDYESLKSENKLHERIIKAIEPAKDTPERSKFISKVGKACSRYSYSTAQKTIQKLFEDDTERQEALTRYQQWRRQFEIQYQRIRGGREM